MRYNNSLIPGVPRSYVYAGIKSMTLEPAKHEKIARLSRISNVFRIAGAQSAEQSVSIKVEKYLSSPEIIVLLLRFNRIIFFNSIESFFYFNLQNNILITTPNKKKGKLSHDTYKNINCRRRFRH